MHIERSNLADDTIVLRLSGIVSDDLGQSIDDEVLSEADYGRQIVVSMRDVTLLNSSGIGMLLRIHRETASQGGKLVISNLAPMVRQTIEFMRLDKVLIIARDEQEACEMLK